MFNDFHYSLLSDTLEIQSSKTHLIVYNHKSHRAHPNIQYLRSNQIQFPAETTMIKM